MKQATIIDLTSRIERAIEASAECLTEKNKAGHKDHYNLANRLIDRLDAACENGTCEGGCIGHQCYLHEH